jgi:hypothetical protein
MAKKWREEEEEEEEAHLRSVHQGTTPWAT